VTEAIATKGGSVTFEQYRSTLAQLYPSLFLADLSLLAMRIDRVGEKTLLALAGSSSSPFRDR
jgi:hypothetical protein